MFAIVAISFVSLLLVTPQARAFWTIDSQGQLFESSSGQVLSKGSDDSGGGSSGSSNSSDSSKEGSGESSGSSGSGSSETKTETGGTSEEQQKSESELRLPDETRVINKIKNGETKTEVRNGKVKVRLEQKNGEIKMKVENEETGEEQELETKEAPENEEENDLLTIKERENENNIKVSTTKDKFIIKRKGVGAVSSFPLSVDLSTNALIVTTPAGERQVAILPDQAVQNMLAQNILSQVATPSVTTSLSTLVQLTQAPSGTLEFEIEGTKQEKALGFIPVNIKKTAVVSAQTGALVATRETLQNQLLDLISF